MLVVFLSTRNDASKRWASPLVIQTGIIVLGARNSLLEGPYQALMTLPFRRPYPCPSPGMNPRVLSPITATQIFLSREVSGIFSLIFWFRLECPRR